jgi:hypothetical protein
MPNDQRGPFTVPSGKALLRGIDYTFPAAQQAGILGNNGAGGLLWTPYDPYNVIVNGDFSVFQIGNGPSPSVGGIRYADCWYGVSNSAATFQHSQYTGAQPIGSAWATTMLQHLCVTGDASVAAGDFVTINTPIEGWRARSLMNGSALSFWVVPPSSGIQTVALQNKAGTWVYLMSFAVTAGVWNYCTAVIPAFDGSIISTSNMTTNIGFWFYVNQMIGATYGGTVTGAWQNTAAFGTTSQTNWMATGGAAIYYYGFNLIPGQIPMPFIPHGYDYELARAMRYRQVLINGISGDIGNGTCSGSSTGYVSARLPAPMLGAPAMALSAISHFSAYQGGATILTGLSINSSTKDMIELAWAVGTSPFTIGQSVLILPNTASARVTLESYPT